MKPQTLSQFAASLPSQFRCTFGQVHLQQAQVEAAIVEYLLGKDLEWEVAHSNGLFSITLSDKKPKSETLITPADFLSRHRTNDPDDPGKGIADSFSMFVNMQEAWDHADPDTLIWIASRHGVLTSTELNGFSMACARRVQHLVKDQSLIAAMYTEELCIEGRATDKNSTSDMFFGKWVWLSSGHADVSHFSKWVAETALASSNPVAELHWQATWLRENTKPNFSLNTVETNPKSTTPA